MTNTRKKIVESGEMQHWHQKMSIFSIFVLTVLVAGAARVDADERGVLRRVKRTFDPTKNSLTQDDRAQLLAIHNNLRAGVSGATDMTFMVVF